MNNKRLYILICVLILLFLLIFALSFIKSNKNSNMVSSSDEAASYYILKEYNQKIALFSNVSSTPIEVYDIFVSSLPFKDEELVKEGIICSTKKEAILKLEDYE